MISLEMLFAALIGVAAILLILLVVMVRMNRRVGTLVGGRPASAPLPQQAVGTAQGGGEAQLVAVITAAIAAATGKPVHTLRVRRIRRSDASLPAWERAGRRDNMVE